MRRQSSNSRFVNSVLAGVVLGVFTLVATGANAAIDTYKLKNHPDGAIAPPEYGLRLDELFQVSGYPDDDFTFDFEYTGAEMFLDFDSELETIHIHGRAFGGLDLGDPGDFGGSDDTDSDGYHDDYSGYWIIDFLFDNNVTVSAGSDTVPNDLLVDPDSNGNRGTLEFEAGQGVSGIDDDETYYMTDYDGDGAGDGPGFAFKFNDEDDHRLPDEMKDEGIFVGWGWLKHDDSYRLWKAKYNDASDWLFIAEKTPDTSMDPVPEPTSLLVWSGLAFACGLGARRRSRRASA